MSLMQELQIIQNKDYVPIYSGRIKTAKTYVSSVNKSNQFLYALNRGKIRSDFRSAITRNTSLKCGHHEDVDTNQYESSTNISLLSCDSQAQDVRIDYGNLGHYSPFERYTNSKCFEYLNDHREFVKKYLKHYVRFLKLEQHELVLEPAMYELFEHDELERLNELSQLDKIKPKDLRAHSVACQREIIFYERKFLYQNPSIKRKSRETRLEKRRHSVPSGKYQHGIKHKVAREIAKSTQEIKFGLNFNDLSFSTFKATNIKSPRESLIFSKKFEPQILSRAKTSLSVTRSSTKSVESKLKSYIRPKSSMQNLEKPSMSKLIKKLSKEAINLHTRKSDKRDLFINQNLSRLIENEEKQEKGPVYFVALTRENLIRFESNKQPVRQQKNLFLFEWLQDMDLISFTNDTCLDFDNVNDIDDRSLNAQIDSHNFISSYSNILTNSFVSNLGANRTPSPNIFLPHFVSNNPNKTRYEGTQLKYNDAIVQRIVNEYKRNHCKIDVNYRPYGNDTYSATTRRTLSAYLASDQKVIIREKLRKEQLKNDLLLTRMKLDLYAL